MSTSTVSSSTTQRPLPVALRAWQPLLLASSALAIAAWSVLIAAPADSPAEAAVNCSASPASLSDPNIAAMWRDINNARVTGGKPALQWSNTLATSAAWMARDASTRPDTSDPTFPSLIDSLGRDPRTRMTDCGYRTDATVDSSVLKVTIDNPDGAYTIWSTYNNLQLYRIIHDLTGSYVVGGLGYAVNPSSYYPYFWVLDVGTQPDSGSIAPPANTPVPTNTPVLPSNTSVPPTSTPWGQPTATQQPAGATVTPTSITIKGSPGKGHHK